MGYLRAVLGIRTDNADTVRAGASSTRSTARGNTHAKWARAAELHGDIGFSEDWER